MRLDVIRDDCWRQVARQHQSPVCLRIIVGSGTELNRVIILGAGHYETLESNERREHPGQPRIGIGANCRIENAILDKNARTGNNVTISPAGKPGNVGHELYFIRDGIVIVPRKCVMPHGTVI